MAQQEDPAFPIPTWQTTPSMIKESTMVRIEELRNQHSGDEDELAKILVCENRIKDKTFCRQYSGKEKKIFFEFSCPFRIKRYATSGTSSQFTLIQINHLK